MTKAEKLVEKFKRNLLQCRLDECTISQRDFFHRIFPNGVPEEKLTSAIDLCDRTIKKNKAGRD